MPTLLGLRSGESKKLFPEFETVGKQPHPLSQDSQSTIICNTSVKSPIHHVETRLPFQVSLD